MRREILNALADLFSNRLADTLLGIAGGYLVADKVEIAWAILVAIGITAICAVLGVILKYWSEKIPPNIVFSPAAFLENESQFKDGDHLLTHWLPLSIINKEHHPLTEVSAFLVYALYGGEKVSLSNIMSGSQPAYIGWKGTENCRVDIDAHGGEQTLYLYRTTLMQDKEGNKTFSFNSFNFCGTSRSVILATPGEYLIRIKLEFRGTLNGKAVKTKDFIGYVKLTMRADASGTLSLEEGTPTGKEIEDANKTRTIKG